MSAENDLSDEAFFEWDSVEPNILEVRELMKEISSKKAALRLRTWRECRRRAEAMIEERERNAWSKSWAACYRWVRDEHEEAPNCDAAYRAYQEKNK